MRHAKLHESQTVHFSSWDFSLKSITGFFSLHTLSHLVLFLSKASHPCIAPLHCTPTWHPYLLKLDNSELRGAPYSITAPWQVPCISSNSDHRDYRDLVLGLSAHVRPRTVTICLPFSCLPLSCLLLSCPPFSCLPFCCPPRDGDVGPAL